MRCSKPGDPCARNPTYDVCAALRLVGGEQGRVLGVPTVLSRGNSYTSGGERVLAAASGKHGRVAEGHWGYHVCQEVFVSRRWRRQHVVRANSGCGGIIFIHEHIGHARSCIAVVIVIVVAVTAVLIFANIAIAFAVIVRGGGSLRHSPSRCNNRHIAKRRPILGTMHRGNGRQDTVRHRPSQLPRPCAGPLRPVRIRWRQVVPVLSGQRAVPRGRACVAHGRVLGI